MRLPDRWWRIVEKRLEAASVKRAVEVRVTTDRDSYRPGDGVTASIHVEARKPLNIRAGTAELVCLGTYSPLTLWSLDKGMPLTHVRDRRALLGRTQLLPGEPEQFMLSFHIPMDAPPTYHGSGIYTHWWVQAGIDAPSVRSFFDRLALLHEHIPWYRRFVSDQVAWQVRFSSGSGERALIKVCRPAHSAPRPEGPTQRSGSSCRIDVALADVWVAEGQAVRGSVTVVPRRDLEEARVAVQLNRVEAVRSSIGRQVERVTDAGAILAERRKLVRGLPESFPFEFTVPSALQPLLVTRHGQAYREVAAVVSANGRQHAVTRVPFFVYNCLDGSE